MRLPPPDSRAGLEPAGSLALLLLLELDTAGSLALLLLPELDRPCDKMKDSGGWDSGSTPSSVSLRGVVNSSNKFLNTFGGVRPPVLVRDALAPRL